jgi:uncharacterized phage protein (TIGR02218 family)
MTRIWFDTALETVATFWRVLRRDGVALGFATHDQDIWIDGIRHQAAPGLVPSAIRRSADFEPDSAEVQGALSHASIAAEDLVAGRFDGASVLIGVVDWHTGENAVLYRGSIGAITEQAGTFTAALQSRKAELQRDPVPRTSPACRAAFCGPGCTLSAARFTHEATLAAYDPTTGAATLDCAIVPADLLGGTIRWFDGPCAGITMGIAAIRDGAVLFDGPIDAVMPPGTRAHVRQGCDRTIGTCGDRFGNAINFQGEPYLPGNDLVARYPAPSQ